MDADTDCVTVNNVRFSEKCWNGFEITEGSFQTLTSRYMPKSDSNRYSNGDEVLIWTITFDTEVDNIKNEKFVLKGARYVSTVLGTTIAAIALFTF